jgi:hypothetical protein
MVAVSNVVMSAKVSLSLHSHLPCMVVAAAAAIVVMV